MSERVLVIGGTRGVGLLTARLLHQRGFRVRVMARDPATAAKVLGDEIEIVTGDLTRRKTLAPAGRDVDHIVFTAGVPSATRASERLVKATDYDGVLDTLAAAKAEGFRGRFVYLNSLGVTTPSLAAWLINLMKRNTLVWRRRVEDDIRASGVDYTIIRVGFLNDSAGGTRAIRMSQDVLPLTPWNRISRADVAEVFVEALVHPSASRATFDIVWDKGPRRQAVAASLAHLKRDPAPRAVEAQLRLREKLS